MSAPPTLPTICVLVVDDHPVVGTGVVALLRGSRVKVIRHATDIDQGVQGARRHGPTVILLDLRLAEGVLSIPGIGRLQAAAPDASIVMFTAFPDHPAVSAAMKAGAVGCLVKDTGRNDLVAGIIAAAERRPLPVRPLAVPTRVKLSSREYEILIRVSVGATNAEIGHELFLAPNTVKTYWQNALDKLGARNRPDAIRLAYKAGIL